MKRIGVVLFSVVVGLLLYGSRSAEASFFQNTFGLSEPHSTITFSEHVFPDGTGITTEYADLGVTFSPFAIYWAPGQVLSFWPYGQAPGLRQIQFARPQTEAAFAFVTYDGAVGTFQAILGGNIVETATATVGGGSVPNFYGFRGITFDAICISTNAWPAWGVDNIQLQSAAPPDHIVIKPLYPMVAVGGSIPFTATVYDAQNNVLPTSVIWSITNPDAGSISSTGVFKAGLIAGTYENAVTASTSEGSVIASTSVTVHFPDTTNIIDMTYGIGAGSFELGNLVINGFMSLPPGSTTIAGWTVGGPGDGVDWCTLPQYAPSDGSNSVDLAHVIPSSISTVIPTPVGGRYLISFDTAANIYWAGGNTGTVSAGSMLNQAFAAPYSSSLSAQTYSSLTFEFTATEPTTTVRFTSTGTGGYGPVIDNVSVVPASALFGGVLKVSPSFEFSLEPSSQGTYSIQVANSGSDVQSATLEVLNAHSGLTVDLPPENPVSLAPGETKVIPIVLDSGQMPVGVYDGIQLKITGNDGSPFYSNIKVHIVPQGTGNLPDLTLSSKDIRIIANSPDGKIALTADIHNQGLSSASNVQVRFYEFDDLLGETVIAEIPANGVRSTSITVPMDGSGDRLVRVEIDPSGIIQELDKTNNEASQVVQPGGSPGAMEGNILVTGSLPSTVYTGSLFNIGGQAVYDVYVDGVRNTDYVVKGGAVQVTITGNGGAEWVYGDVHTDVNGNFLKSLQAPTSPGTYRIFMTVTDHTFLGKRELVLTVSDPPPPTSPTPPPNPPTTTSGIGAWTYSGGTGGSGGTWTWSWTTPPVNGPAPQSDLRVFSENIRFSKNHPAPEEEITIYAEIGYWATSTGIVAHSVPVNLYVTDPGTPKMKIGQTLIDTISVGAPDFGSRYVYGTWKNQAQGIYIVEVEIDPSYLEENRLNNAATRAIVAGQLQGFQGAVAGQVTNPWGGVGGVTIHVFDSSGTDLLGSTLTDPTGYYLYENVPVGAAQVGITTPSGYSPDAAMKTATVTNPSVSEVDFRLSAATLKIGLGPASAVNDMGLKNYSHTVTALVTDSLNNPQPNLPVAFTVSRMNAGVAGVCNPVNCTTDASGHVSFTYSNALHMKGSDTITASFTNQAGQPVTSQAVTKSWIMKCDLNNDGKINTNDINIIFAGRGLKRPGDPRDIDGDGWITVNDARGCVLQCTKPNCAL